MCGELRQGVPDVLERQQQLFRLKAFSACVCGGTLQHPLQLFSMIAGLHRTRECRAQLRYRRRIESVGAPTTIERHHDRGAPTRVLPNDSISPRESGELGESGKVRRSSLAAQILFMCLLSVKE